MEQQHVVMKNGDILQEYSQNTTSLTPEQVNILQAQDTRIVAEKRANRLETEAKKNWDLFYKRNGERFFKDRHWTGREFEELSGMNDDDDGDEEILLLEVGCGAGNLIYPLLELNTRLRVLACDISEEAVRLVRSHPDYDDLHEADRLTAFSADVTLHTALSEHVGEERCDLVSLVFVLSAVLPAKWPAAIETLKRALRPGGCVLFRDYARYDMAQLRFKPGTKIADNLYVRQDNTRTYFFETEELKSAFESVGFETVEIRYVHRRTVNIKEKVDVPRIFLQAKFRKPVS